MAKGLVAAGIEAGDRVALISKTRYEWTLLDYAIWFAGAVTVPVYETSSAEQVGWILQDSGARAVVAEGPDHLARVTEVRGDLERAATTSGRSPTTPSTSSSGSGPDISDDDARGAAYGRRRPLDLATLIYTSGTTGRPKGCMLTHGNFMVELGVARRRARASCSTDGRLDAAVPAAGARVRPDHPDRLREAAGPARPQRRHQEPRRRPAAVPADVRARRAAGLREGLQHRLAAGHRRRPRRDLRPRRRDRHRLLARPRQGPAVAGRPRPARRLLAARLRQAARRARRPSASTPSPAARRSATGSATSTAASA